MGPNLSTHPTVTIVVPTKNCAESIGALLTSIQNQSYRDFETIVVDSSDDETSNIASSYNVSIIRCVPKGLTMARNLGIKNGSGEIVCFTDGDCTMELDWLHLIVTEFQKDSKIGCVGGSVLSNEDSFLGRYCSEALIPAYPVYYQPSIIADPALAELHFGGVRFPVGCNLAFKREALNEVGGFNEKWLSTWDEFEILTRLLNKGFAISINPEIVVYHKPRKSILEATRQAYTYGQGFGTFSRMYRNSHPRNRLLSTLIEATKTISHSVGLFKKSSRFSVFVYPIIDMLLGFSYYAGFAVGYTKDQNQQDSIR